MVLQQYQCLVYQVSELALVVYELLHLVATDRALGVHILLVQMDLSTTSMPASSGDWAGPGGL